MRAGRRTGLAGVAAALVPLLALAGCVGGGSGAPTPHASSPTATPLPADVLAGLSVEIRQARSDWALRVVQLRVANVGTTDVTVARATLSTPDDDGDAASDRSRRIPAGIDRDVSVALGDPVCDGRAAAASAAASPGAVSVRLEVVDEAGRTGTVVVEPADPQGHLARIHGEDCAALAVAAGARLSLGDALATSTDASGRLVATVDLRVAPVAGGPRVEVTSVDGTNLFAPSGTGADSDAAAAWTTDVDTASGDDRTVALTLAPTRCDAHAVAEDKRGTFFGVHARVDGVEQPVFYLTSSDALRKALHEYVGRSCGWPTG